MGWPAEELWATGYREWRPPAGLHGAVACFWVSVTASGKPSVAKVMPDGCSDLIWQRGRGAFVAGPDTGPAPAELPAGTVLVGVRFWPGAGGPALGLPLAELRDERVDLADCLPRLASQLPADLTPNEAVGRVSAVAGQLVTTGPPDKLVLKATEMLAAGQLGIARLSRAIGLSERQLRRRFDEAAGYGPKTMHRVLRFRQVIRHLAMAPDQVDLASLAWRTGYADQAHLTRETTRLAGLSPAALARTLRPSPDPCS
jgi:AraC-like DNA-binding protein